ncbi:uncharacterized protein LOC129587015 [Paramacrobiotus metropolitanus]|uniref:uncharacterized protein LOC129587015 n=1 Tax=Paramacrobiotus metropolitanus TaxID=2943436 RepID=UPI002445C3FB|nr:uncharacterized protein LOC129587015 [Paramacrobiotus metropolitanus]
MDYGMRYYGLVKKFVEVILIFMGCNLVSVSAASLTPGTKFPNPSITTVRLETFTRYQTRGVLARDHQCVILPSTDEKSLYSWHGKPAADVPVHSRRGYFNYEPQENGDYAMNLMIVTSQRSAHFSDITYDTYEYMSICDRQHPLPHVILVNMSIITTVGVHVQKSRLPKVMDTSA